MNNRILYAVIGLVAIVAGGIIFWQASRNQEEVNNSQMLTNQPDVDLATEDGVKYYADASGFFAQPVAEGSYPGVVMVHEWWGLNENIKDMARELARSGYRVLAVDLHGEVATDATRARELTSTLDQTVAIGNMKAAMEFLKNKGAQRIGVLGWCFGGGQALQLSLSGETLDATVIYYGQLVTDRQRLEAIDWPVLGIFGDKDTSIPVEQVTEFETALNELDIKNSINIYPGIGHAFANPSGTNYAAAETQDAWNKTLAFLEANLK